MGPLARGDPCSSSPVGLDATAPTSVGETPRDHSNTCPDGHYDVSEQTNELAVSHEAANLGILRVRATNVTNVCV